MRAPARYIGTLLPFTLETIRCFTLKPMLECSGSMVQVAADAVYEDLELAVLLHTDLEVLQFGDVSRYRIGQCHQLPIRSCSNMLQDDFSSAQK